MQNDIEKLLSDKFSETINDSAVTRTPGSLLVSPGTPSFLELSGRKKENEILVLICCSS
jgi:hypothetical protein